MIRAICICLAIVFCCACSNTTVRDPRVEYPVANVEEVNGVWTEKTTNQPITGIIKRYYESGMLKSESRYKDGRLDDMSIMYYDDGRLNGKIRFKDGEPIRGTCGGGRELTSAELADSYNGLFCKY